MYWSASDCWSLHALINWNMVFFSFPTICFFWVIVLHYKSVLYFGQFYQTTYMYHTTGFFKHRFKSFFWTFPSVKMFSNISQHSLTFTYVFVFVFPCKFVNFGTSPSTTYCKMTNLLDFPVLSCSSYNRLLKPLAFLEV